MDHLEPAPAELSYIADHIGDLQTLRLVEEFGGCRVYVPHKPRQHSVLARVIGLAEARALAVHFGGVDLKVPIARAWRVKIYTRRGETVRAIARRLGVTQDTIQRLRLEMGLSRRSNRAQSAQAQHLARRPSATPPPQRTRA